jgi:hypothetical protein
MLCERVTGNAGKGVNYSGRYRTERPEFRPLERDTDTAPPRQVRFGTVLA